MDCREVREEILACAGTNETPPAEVRDHIERCAGCRLQRQSAADVWALLSAHEAVEPRADFFDRVREKIHRIPLRRVLAPLAAAAAIVLAIFFGLRGGDPDRTSGGGPAVVDLTSEEREIIANLDLLENYELLKTMEAVGGDLDGLLREEE